MKIKGIFFDLYGTLMIYGDMDQAWSDWLSTLHKALLNAGLDISIEELSKHCHGFFSQDEPTSDNKQLTVFERRIQALTTNLGLNMSNKEINSIALSCLNSWHKYIHLDPEAIPVLKSLKQHKKIALITNFEYPPHIYNLLMKLGLRKYFDSIIISAEVGVKKPHPEIFSFALNNTGLKPNEVVYIGDTRDDVQGALEASIFPILIRRQEHEGKKSMTDFKSNDTLLDPFEDDFLLTKTKKITNLTELLEMNTI